MERLLLLARRRVTGSVLVRFQSEYSRAEVVSRLSAALRKDGQPLVEVTLPGAGVCEELGRAGAATVSIAGFERHAVSQRLHPLLLELNLHRERIGRLGKFLIWWATPEVADQVAERIPDFDSWFLLRLSLTESWRRDGERPLPDLERRKTWSWAAESFDEQMERARRAEWEELGKREQSRIAEELLELLPQIDDPVERASRLDRLVAKFGWPVTVKTKIALSRVLRGLGRVEDAFALATAAAEFMDKERDTVRADVYLTLGESLADQGRFEEATEAMRKAAEIGDRLLTDGRLTRPDVHGYVLLRLGWLQGATGHDMEALAALRSATAMFDGPGESDLALAANQALGRQLGSMGRFEEAYPILRRTASAAKVMKSWDASRVQVQSTFLAAAALQDMGRMAEALKELGDGPGFPGETEAGQIDLVWAIRPLLLRAELQLRLGEATAAHQSSSRAIATFRKGTEEWTGESWRTIAGQMQELALTEFRCGYVESANELVRMAEEVFAAHKEELDQIPLVVVILYRTAAEIAISQGAMDAALRAIERSIAAATAFPAERGEDARRLQLAMSYAVAGRVLPGNWFERAHATAAEIGQEPIRLHAEAGIHYHEALATAGETAVAHARASLRAYKQLGEASPERWRTRILEAYAFLAEQEQMSGLAEAAIATRVAGLQFLGDNQSELARRIRSELQSGVPASNR